MAARDLFSGSLGGDTDAGQCSEVVPPYIAAHVNGFPSAGHEREGTFVPRCTNAEGPRLPEVAVELRGVARGHRPNWTGTPAEVTTYEPPGLEEYRGRRPCDSGLPCERTHVI